MGDANTFLEWILSRHARLGGLTEVRLLRKTPSGEHSTYSGLYSPALVDKLRADLQPVTPQPRKRIPPNDHAREREANCYFSLNAVKPELAKGRLGQLARVKTAVKDRDIYALSLMLIDIDPVRPSNVSATDNEKELAFEVAEAVDSWLIERGIRTIRADSGNGYHLLIPLKPVSGEAIPDAAQDAKDLLKLLDERFSRKGVVKVDTGNFNPSRISKLYETMAVKGVHSQERPHRRSSIDLLKVPEDVDPFEILRDEIEAYRARHRKGKRVRAIASGNLSDGRTAAVGTNHRSATSGPTSSGVATRTRAPGRHAAGSAATRPDPWPEWRAKALDALSLEEVYGDHLTGKVNGEGWHECRDPDSPTGDRNPSAGVADGSGPAERGAFHSFISGDTVSVFDFLINRGVVHDFASALSWVAERSGVPLPGRLETLPSGFQHYSAKQGRASPNGADTPPCSEQACAAPFDLSRVDAFIQELQLEDDPLAKPQLVREFLNELLDAPMLELHVTLERIQAVTGYPLRALKRVMSELQDEGSDDDLEPPPEGVQVIDIVRGREAISSLFLRIVEVLGEFGRFYEQQGGLCCLRPGRRPVTMTEANLSGLLTGVIEFRIFQYLGRKRRLIGYEPLTPQLCRAFVNSQLIPERLPPLATWTQAPLFTSDWTWVGKRGYYPTDGGVYYDGPEVQPKVGEPRRLEAFLRGSFWKEPADKVNFIGALLTALTLSSWTNGHAVILVNGNRTSCGKSILVQALALIADGRKAPSITFSTDQAEFEKQLATQVEEGSRTIFIDNVKLRRPVESAVLERTVTDWVPNFRRLGTNSSITRISNDLLVCLTMNKAVLGDDMRRRVLPINLFMARAKQKREGAVKDPKTWLLKHRLELVAELAGMVQRWLDAGRPMPDDPATHTTSDEWAGTIDAILRVNGYEGFLSNYDASMGAIDENYMLMLEICKAHSQRPPQTAAEWAAELRSNLLEERFKDRRGQLKSEHAQALMVARLFNDYGAVTFEVEGEKYRMVRSEPNGATHSPLFGFELSAAEEDSTD